MCVVIEKRDHTRVSSNILTSILKKKKEKRYVISLLIVSKYTYEIIYI